MSVISSSTEILVLDSSGGNLGRMSYSDAKELSENINLDLVQVNKKDDNIPVYKIMDHGKWKYQNSKNKKNNKTSSHSTKEIGFKIRTEKHDIETKIAHIKKFISKGHDVKISVMMRGRERSRPNIAEDKLLSLVQQIDSISSIYQEGKTSNSVYCIVRPSGLRDN